LYWRRLVTAGGLWWNVIWWEWALLDGKDIFLGWAQNLAIIITPLLIGGLFGWIFGVVALVVMLILLRPLLGLCFKALKIRS